MLGDVDEAGNHVPGFDQGPHDLSECRAEYLGTLLIGIVEEHSRVATGTSVSRDVDVAGHGNELQFGQGSDQGPGNGFGE